MTDGKTNNLHRRKQRHRSVRKPHCWFSHEAAQIKEDSGRRGKLESF